MKTNSPQPQLYSPEELQSATIDLLRFPLIFMVIFIHLSYTAVHLPDADFPLFSEQGILNLLYLSLSDGICRLAVPTFFIISGYLFFINVTDFTWEQYKYKIKRRFRSLVIPYFLWNLIAIILSVAALALHPSVSFVSFNSIPELISNGWHLFYDAHAGIYPIDFPLWFVRDLIVVSLLSPLIYWYVKKLGIFGLILILVAGATKMWISLPGFSITAFFYFPVGAYFAINRYNIVEFSRRYKSVIIVGAIILYGLYIYFNGEHSDARFAKIVLFSLFGAFAFFYLGSQLIVKYHVKPNRMLLSSCLFVLALHAILSQTMIRATESLIHYIIPGTSFFEDITVYILTPIITALICLAIFAFCRKYLPTLTRLLTGNK
jgi:surface polysaccharide O-acyltransferase-like enzyme